MRYCFCIVGWHFFEEFYENVYKIKCDKYIISHRDRDFLTNERAKLFEKIKNDVYFCPNRGLDWGGYHQFNAMNFHQQYDVVIYCHDDLVIKDLSFVEAIAEKFQEVKIKVIGNGNNGPDTEFRYAKHKAGMLVKDDDDFVIRSVRGSFFAARTGIFSKLGNFPAPWHADNGDLESGNIALRNFAHLVTKNFGIESIAYLDADNRLETRYLLEMRRGGDETLLRRLHFSGYDMKDSLATTRNTALDENYMRGVLTPIVQERFGQHTRVHSLTTEPLQSRLLRYTIQIFDSEKKKTVETWMIGKACETPNQMEQSFKRMQQLWKQGFSCIAEDGIFIPAPYQGVEELSLILMEEAPGVALSQLVKKMFASPDHLRVLANAMAKLHRCPLILGKPFTIKDELLSCDPSPQILAQAYPELANEINYIIETAKAVQAGFGENIFTLIHGDFHPKHVHVDNGKAWIFDVNSLKYADPARDLAEIFIFLKRTDKKKRMSNYIAGLRDAFLTEYFSKNDWQISRRIPLYEGLIHLKRACKRFRLRDEADWEVQLKFLIEQGAACLRTVEKKEEKLDLEKVIRLYHACPGSI